MVITASGVLATYFTITITAYTLLPSTCLPGSFRVLGLAGVGMRGVWFWFTRRISSFSRRVFLVMVVLVAL
jgi:hypothetical protein